VHPELDPELDLDRGLAPDLKLELDPELELDRELERDPDLDRGLAPDRDLGRAHALVLVGAIDRAGVAERAVGQGHVEGGAGWILRDAAIRAGFIQADVETVEKAGAVRAVHAVVGLDDAVDTGGAIGAVVTIALVVAGSTTGAG